MKCEGLNPESYAQYVLGTAPEEERSRIENHLMLGCETCASEIKAYETLWHQVALQTPLTTPPPALRKRILREVRGRRAEQESPLLSWASFRRPVPVLVGLSAAALAISVGYMAGSRARTITIAQRDLPVAVAPAPVLSPEPVPTPQPQTPTAPEPRSVNDTKELTALRVELAQARADNAQLQAQFQAQLQQPAASVTPAPVTPQTPPQTNNVADQQAAEQLAQLRERLAAATARITALERQAQQYQTLIDLERKRADQSTMIASLVTNPSLRVIPFKGTELARGAEGRVLIAGDQMLMVSAHLPPPPRNRTYQLWLVRSKSPAIASAGTFYPDGNSEATLQFGNRELLTQVTAVAVTDEPVGGSLQPTGHKWVIGVNSGF